MESNSAVKLWISYDVRGSGNEKQQVVTEKQGSVEIGSAMDMRSFVKEWKCKVVEESNKARNGRAKEG